MASLGSRIGTIDKLPNNCYCYCYSCCCCDCNNYDHDHDRDRDGDRDDYRDHVYVYGGDDDNIRLRGRGRGRLPQYHTRPDLRSSPGLLPENLLDGCLVHQASNICLLERSGKLLLLGVCTV